MTPRRGAGGAAVLFAALFPAACLQTVVLPPPGQKSGVGGGGGGVAVDGGGLGGTPGLGDAGGVLCPSGPGSLLRLSHADPTVMFTVDHSNSMMTTHLSNNGPTRLGAVQAVIKDLLGRFANRTSAGYMVNFGYLEFPQIPRTGICPSNGCCVGTAYLNTGGDAIRMAIDRCATGGQNCLSQMDATTTTTVDALDKVRSTFQQIALNDPQKFTVLLTDHEPANCSSSGDPCDDAALQIGSLERNLGVPTYVVVVGDGLPTDNTGVNRCLDLMASSSKARRPGSPDYYSATSESQVRQFVTNPVLGSLCYAQVDDGSFDPSRTQIVVDIDGQRIDRDPNRTSGWDFDELSNGHTGIMFFGPACENSFLTNQFQKVHATVCPR